MSKTEKIIEWKCSHCKGEITFECFPIWNIESQTFDLFFDPKQDNYCGKCWSPQMATAVVQEVSNDTTPHIETDEEYALRVASINMEGIEEGSDE